MKKKLHQCEMTGKEFEGTPVKIMVEGVELSVAPENAKFGVPVKKEYGQKNLFDSAVRRASRPHFKKPQSTFEICANFGSKIKQKREQMGMRQQDLARFLNERESMIHQIESEHYKPPELLARKIEKKLSISLQRVQAEQEDEFEVEHQSRDGFTIGDLIKKK